jgi:hypothetical protein
MFRKFRNAAEFVLGKRTNVERMYGKAGCTTHACETLGIKVYPTDKGRDTEKLLEKLDKRGIRYEKWRFDIYGNSKFKLIPTSDDLSSFKNGFMIYDSIPKFEDSTSKDEKFEEYGHIVSFKTVDGVKTYHDVNNFGTTLQELNSVYGKPAYLINLL